MAFVFATTSFIFALTKKNARPLTISQQLNSKHAMRIASSLSLSSSSNNHDFDNLLTSHHGSNPKTNKRHAPIVYHDRYSAADWPTTHTFPMDKFRATAQSLLTNKTKSSSSSSPSPPLVQSPLHFYQPLLPPHNTIIQPTGPILPQFYHSFLTGTLSSEQCRIIGFRNETYKPSVIQRTLLEVGGTILTCQLALRYGVASNVAGGTHHAHEEMGAGYTILNDLAIASQFLLSLNCGVRRVLVIDCDVHQGDGTAKFGTLDIVHNDDDDVGQMFTLSIHAESNYPQPKATSTYDVGLPDGANDDDYMEALISAVNRAWDDIHPDFVLYDAGVDVYVGDSLGRLSLTEDGIRQRDHWVLDHCVKEGVPVAAVVGGGYDDDVGKLGRRHCIVHEECASVWRKYRMWDRC